MGRILHIQKQNDESWLEMEDTDRPQPTDDTRTLTIASHSWPSGGDWPFIASISNSELTRESQVSSQPHRMPTAMSRLQLPGH
jgi:hypothetical protein